VNVKHAFFAVSLAITMMCAAAPRMETTIRVAVPKEVAAEAAVSAPVLMLQGLEVMQGERMRIDVLGPLNPKTKTRPGLAVTGLVGSNTPPPNATKETTDLVIPLNDRAARLLAKTDEVTLTLRLRNGRHPLKFKRAYLVNR